MLYLTVLNVDCAYVFLLAARNRKTIENCRGLNMEIVLLTALGVGGATVIGSLIGFAFKKLSHKFSDIILSFAAGVVLSSAVPGLVLPSLEYGGKYSVIITIAGIFAGALCLNFIDKLVPHIHKLIGPDSEEHRASDLSRVILFVTAIAIHNLPEGIAAGVGFGFLPGFRRARLSFALCLRGLSRWSERCLGILPSAYLPLFSLLRSLLQAAPCFMLSATK